MTNDETKLEMALKLYSDGEVEKSAELSLEVYKNTTDAFIKLQAVNFLTSSLNKAEHNPRLVAFCDEGISLSEQLERHDIKATYLALKAECLMHRCMVLHYKMINLRLSPGWSGFSLESEKLEYEELSKKKSNYEAKLSDLLSEAIEIAGGAPDKMILARVLRSRALVYGGERLILSIGGLQYSKLFLYFLNNFNIQLGFLFKNRKEMRETTDKCKDNFLKSIAIAKSLGNELECAYTLFNLAGEMNGAGEKSEAKKYLREAEKLAHKLNEKILIRQASLLKKMIHEKISKEYSKPPVFKGDDY